MVAGLGWRWLLRPLTSLGRLVPGCRARVDLDPVCQRQLAGAAIMAAFTMREDLHRRTFSARQDSTSSPCMRAKARRCSREMCIWENPTLAAISY